VVERYILLSSLIARRVKYATSTLEMPVMELSRKRAPLSYLRKLGELVSLLRGLFRDK
jgi:hypothetical protein